MSEPKQGQVWKLDDHSPIFMLLYRYQSKDMCWRVLCWNGQLSDVGEWSIGYDRSSLVCAGPDEK